MKSILENIRRYEIKIRKAIDSQMQGDFKSVFKGAGLEFDDVRQYQWGDDVRTIDWKVTAKGHGTYVKTFIEEKEQSIFFLMDVSSSQNIGKKKKKLDIAKEIVGILSLSAVKKSSKVGVLCFSNQLELYIKPNKSLKHAYEIINRLINLKTSSKETNLKEAVKTSLNLIKRRSVFFIVSDFIDDDYFDVLRGAARKHDLIVIDTYEKREKMIPNLGIVPFLEIESNKTIWVNSSSNSFRKKINTIQNKGKNTLKDFCKKNDIHHLSIHTEEDYVTELIKLFRYRNKENAKRKR